MRFLRLAILLYVTNLSSADIPSDQDCLVQENPQYKRKKTKATSKSSKSHTRATKAMKIEPLKFIKRHRNEITLALAVIAFRREIYQLLESKFVETVHDPDTGETVKVPVLQFNPTSILKVIIFIELMRRLKSVQNFQGSEIPASTLPLIALAFLRGNPGLGIFLSRMLTASSVFVPPIEQHYTFEDINHRYKKDALALRRAYGSGQPVTTSSLAQSLIQRNSTSSHEVPSQYTRSVIVMDMTELDTSLSQLDRIRDQVSFLLSQDRVEALSQKTSSGQNIEVLIILESPGGSASDYALAAQQVLRLRKSPCINVTIAVDKVAASGGYMIASCADEGSLLAAPFAVVGSIGVVGQTINVQKTLENFGVKSIVFRGGKDKAPVGLIGEVTREGMSKVQGMIDDTHRAFKRHIIDARPCLREQIEEIATGQVWIGYDAVEAGLVDRLITSDEYIEEVIAEGARVLKLVTIMRSRNPFKPLSTGAEAVASMGKHLTSLVSRFQDRSIASLRSDHVL